MVPPASSRRRSAPSSIRAPRVGIGGRVGTGDVEKLHLEGGARLELVLAGGRRLAADHRLGGGLFRRAAETPSPFQIGAPPAQKAASGWMRPAGNPRRLRIGGLSRRAAPPDASAAMAPRRTRRAAIAHSEARVAPSSIFSATPRPRAGRMATKTASAPVLTATPVHRRHQLGAGAPLAGDEQRDARSSPPPAGAPRPRAPGRGRAGRPCAPSPARGRGRWWRSSAPSSRRCPSRGSRRRPSPRRPRGPPAAPGGRSRRTPCRRRGGG